MTKNFRIKLVYFKVCEMNKKNRKRVKKDVHILNDLLRA